MQQPQYIDALLQYGAPFALLALVVLALTKHMVKSYDRIHDSMEKLANRIDATTDALIDRVDTGERAVMENINKTRHELANKMAASHEETRQAIDKSEHRILNAFDRAFGGSVVHRRASAASLHEEDERPRGSI